jgi:alkanesulfonate monooxygenase SsuD/methylene tetrahydromethanopterin reductase-like flavin-dependent oxidoreductase (luciferase family)
MNEHAMRYGVVLPGGTAAGQLDQAVLAEQSGWDGVFVWEAAYGPDPWSLLTAVAIRTQRIRLGTMLTPLPWRRPWKVASQVATLDQISGGRAILAVGMGAVDTDLPDTGEVTGLRQRAELLDEGIDLIRTLWDGGTRYHGQHYRYDTGRLDLSRAVQPRRRIPVWVVGVWPRPKSLRRALRCDGLIPQYQLDGRSGNPEDARAVRDWLAAHDAQPGFELVAEGETPGDDPAGAAAAVKPWADAGCTWWLETMWEMPHDSPERMAQIAERLVAGPPRVST